MGCTQMELEVGTEIKAFASPEIASITFVAGSATLEPVALHCVELLSRDMIMQAFLDNTGTLP